MKTKNYNKTNCFITRVARGIEFRVRELGPIGTPFTFTVETERRKVTALMRVRLKGLIRDAACDIREGRDRETVLKALAKNFGKVLAGKIFCRCDKGRIVKKAVGLTPDGKNNLYAPVSVTHHIDYIWTKA